MTADMGSRAPLWRRSAWLIRRRDIERAELERVESTIRYRVGRAIVATAFRPWRLPWAIGEAMAALRAGAKPGSANDPAAFAPSWTYLDVEPDAVDIEELARELDALVARRERIERELAMRLGTALVELRHGVRGARRRWWRITDGAKLGVAPPRVLVPALARFQAPLPVRVSVVGPPWLEAVFAPEQATGSESVRTADAVLVWREGDQVALGADDCAALAARGVSVAAWDGARVRVPGRDGVHESCLGPTIQPLVHNPIGYWQGQPPVRPGWESSAPAAWRALFDEARAGSWIRDQAAAERERPADVAGVRAAAELFRRLRKVHVEDSAVVRLRQAARLFDRSSEADPPDVGETSGPLVSLCLVTHRPSRLLPALRQMIGQTGVSTEIVAVLHGDGFDIGPARELCEEAGVAYRFDQRPATDCLGSLRHRAHELARGPWIAKFDDDDVYGPRYAADMLWEADMSDAAVVTKQRYHLQTIADGRLYYTEGPPWFCYRIAPGAGSQLVRRDVALAVGMRKVRSHDDSAFFVDSRRAGLPVFTSNSYNYVYRRGEASQHSWALRVDELLEHRCARPTPAGVTVDDMLI